jgi:hypothetical protein
VPAVALLCWRRILLSRPPVTETVVKAFVPKRSAA